MLHKVVEITHTSLPDPYRTRFDSGALLLCTDNVTVVVCRFAA